MAYLKNFLIMAVVSAGFCSCGGSEADLSGRGYSGRDLSEEVEIIRDRSTGRVMLNINKSIEWEIYTLDDTDSLTGFGFLSSGKKAGSFALDVPLDKRTYFQFVTDGASSILAERRLPVKGIYNFRDLGGYRNNEGRYVKWGKIFRSDELYGLTDYDDLYLSSIPIVTVVDFRSESEISRNPDKYPASVTNVCAMSISPGNLEDAVMSGNITEDDIAGLMQQMNRLFVTDPTIISQYRYMFELLSDEENIPLVYHCTAGKDRTGMATALILYALGVDEQIIMYDYLRSNEYLEDKFAVYTKQYPQLKLLFEVRSDFLQAGIDEIKNKYGSVESFLTDELNVDIQSFKEIYLY